MVQLSKSIIYSTGLIGDSIYCIIDENNKIVSLRGNLATKLSSLKLTIDNTSNQLFLSFASNSITLDLIPLYSNSQNIEIDIFGDKIKVLEFDQDISLQLSNFFNAPVRLVYRDPDYPRFVSRDRFIEKNQKDTNLQDGYSISVITTATLKYIKRLHGSFFDPNRLRCNLVLFSAMPFIEEDSEYLIFKGGRLRKVERIPRCLTIEKNPLTGEIQQDKLLKTLQSYRNLPKAHNPNKNGLMLGTGYTLDNTYNPLEIKMGDIGIFE